MKKLVILGAIAGVLASCGGDYIAKVNGRGVEASAFEGYLAHKRISLSDDAQRQNVLDDFLKSEALADIVEKDYFKDDAAIQAEIREQEKEILVSRYFQKYLEEQVTDEAVRNFYNNNIERYEEKKIHVAHILLRLNRNMDESQRQVKLTTAQEALSKIQAGMEFSEAAKSYSEDQVSGKNGGVLGWLPEGSIDKKFSDAAFSLKQNELSAIVETPFGYHIIKVLEEPKVTRKSLEAVKGEIRHQLRTTAKEAERKRLLALIKISKG